MDSSFLTVLCGVLVIGIGGFLFLTNAIKIVPEYQRLVVFRLGRCIGTKGPGLIFLIPVIDRAVRADLRRSATIAVAACRRVRSPSATEAKSA